MAVSEGTSRASTSAAYFDDLWSGSDDPWDHATRWYETRKYRLTADALPRERYRRAFEPGCGTGVLTTLLAPRADALLAMERHPHGAAATARRTRGLENVRVVTGTVPHQWPEGSFDLIVLSELLYYLDESTLQATIDLVAASLEVDGHVVAVHYRPVVEAHTWTGDEVHGWLLDQPGWRHGTHILDDDFILDVLSPDG